MPVRALRPLGALLCGLLLLSCAGCSDPGPATGPTAGAEVAPTAEPGRFDDVGLVPEDGAYLGVYYGDRDAEVTDEAIGRTPQIHLTYVGWEDDWTASEVLSEDVDRGQVSLVNWEPFGVDFESIVRGDHDELITARARAAAGLDHPVFLDFAAEMNEEEGWGGHDPALYVEAYRHVHDVFAQHDGGNVVWIWAPNNVDSAGEPGAMDYYPGDDYVDWTGIDGYNWGTDEPGFEWQSFEQVFAPMYADLAELGKPVIIAETSSSEVGGDKAEWIDGIVPTLRSEFPDVRAVVWFDVEKERDWRIRSSAAAGSAVSAMAADDHFAAAVPQR